MISANFVWGNVLLDGELQIYAKNSYFENFESALYEISECAFKRVQLGNSKGISWHLNKQVRLG